ncbi:MAG TPA: hypothetical protein VGY77_02995, partial [Gemmataceae bacterium]|nr:hypothetical protein [Gemmataceae bacterium]
YPSDIKPAAIIKDVSNLRFPNLPKNTNAPDFRKPTDGAPLMAVYAGVLLVGILAGILLRKTSRRPLTVGICCLTAFFLLLVQTTRGFPIESSLKYEIQLAEEEWLGTLSRGERIHEAMFVRMPVPFLMSYSWFLDISLLLPWMALGAVLWEWKVYWKLREEESP